MGRLYGTVVEYVDMSVEEMQGILVRLIGHPLFFDGLRASLP